MDNIQFFHNYNQMNNTQILCNFILYNVIDLT